MSTQNLKRSFTAGGAIERHVFVKMSGSNVVTCGAGEHAIGVSEAAAESGKPVAVIVQGVCEVQAAAALAVGVEVASDASGRAVAVTAEDFRCGLNVEAALAADGSKYDRAVIITQPLKPQEPAA